MRRPPRSTRSRFRSVPAPLSSSMPIAPYVHNASSTKQNVTSRPASSCSHGTATRPVTGTTTRPCPDRPAADPIPDRLGDLRSHAHAESVPEPVTEPVPKSVTKPDQHNAEWQRHPEDVASTVINAAASNQVAINQPAGTAQGDVLVGLSGTQRRGGVRRPVGLVAARGGDGTGEPQGLRLLPRGRCLRAVDVHLVAREGCSQRRGIARYGGVATGNPIDGAVSTATGTASDVRCGARRDDVSGRLDARGMHGHQLERHERDDRLAAGHVRGLGHRRQTSGARGCRAGGEWRERVAHMDVQCIAGLGGLARGPARLILRARVRYDARTSRLTTYGTRPGPPRRQDARVRDGTARPSGSI